jgi:hypothetical protein
LRHRRGIRESNQWGILATRLYCRPTICSLIFDWRRLLRMMTLRFHRHVLAIQPTLQRRQRTSILEYCREQALCAWQVMQRQVLYLGEINDCQHAAWCPVIEAFDETAQRHTRSRCFLPIARSRRAPRGHGVQVRLEAMKLHRPRQWGACWLACELYEQLELDRFRIGRLPDSREGTCWRHIFQTLVCYRLIYPAANGACTASGSKRAQWRSSRRGFSSSGEERAV